MPKKILVIGGNATGLKAAVRIKRLDPAADVTIIEKAEFISYAACGLPYYVEDIVSDHQELIKTPVGVVRDPGFFKAVKGVAVHHKTCAEEIDRKTKKVIARNTETGEVKEFFYDKLVLALGGVPVVPQIEGINLQNIFNLSKLEDGIAIKTLVSAGKVKKVVIVGAGLIGMEMAEAFHKRGAEVTIVEMLDEVLPTLLDRDMGLILGTYLKGKKIAVNTSERVIRFVGDNAVRKVITDKNELTTDLVLAAIGVRPQVDLAKKAGLALGETGAIQINEFLQTSDSDIYAGGDCVENTHRITGKKVFVPMGSTANKHGRIIADHIAGKGLPFPGVLGTAIVKILGFNVARTGLSEKEARAQGYDVDIVICPGADRPHFYPGKANIIIKLIAEKREGRLLGAQIIGPGDVAKRIEVAVTVLSFGGSVKDIAQLDLAYAPPFSPAMDNIITAANVMQNKLQGIARSISPLKVKEKLDHGDEFVFLDVRSPLEYKVLRIEHPNVILMPLGKLREEAKTLARDKEIITFCQVSLRGYEAQRILEGQGFKNVKFMDGGLVGWPFETAGSIW
jgi:NADPH-dependent 2,4-dienoyl-CoA reductase/sulfur reductase-like enzyme/rhodanese-related sulfurtransferase